MISRASTSFAIQFLLQFLPANWLVGYMGSIDILSLFTSKFCAIVFHILCSSISFSSFNYLFHHPSQIISLWRDLHPVCRIEVYFSRTKGWRTWNNLIAHLSGGFRLELRRSRRFKRFACKWTSEIKSFVLFGSDNERVKGPRPETL